MKCAPNAPLHNSIVFFLFLRSFSFVTTKKLERCLLDTHKRRQKYLSSVHDMMPETIVPAKGEENQIKEHTRTQQTPLFPDA